MPVFIHNLRAKRASWIIAAAALLILIGAAIIYIVQLDRRIAGERQRLAEATQVNVEERVLRAPSTDGLTLYLNASDVRAVAAFGGLRYLATSGGLIALDNSGEVKRRYTTFDGLPENDLTALDVFRERLFVGTASAGLIAFDGNNFVAYRFVKPKAAHVTVLTSTASELLIGTLDGGLFEYDGQRFSRRFNSAPGADFIRVTSLLPVESRLYVGTQDDGLYIWREGHTEHITSIDGLPSPHITGLTTTPNLDSATTVVATDFGVVTLTDANQIKPLSNRPNITSLTVSNGHLWAGLFGGGIVDLMVGQPSQSSDSGTKDLSEVAGLPAAIPATVTVQDGELWALTTEGAFIRGERASHPGFELVAGSLIHDHVLTAGHITSLAGDGSGKLWVGYFDRGIDLLSPATTERLSHIETDRVREINYLAFDRSENKMMTATSRGLVVFGDGLKQTVVTREQGGLINDSVAHVTFADVDSRLLRTSTAGSSEKPTGRSVVLATAGGLTEISGGRARSITAFHGLASNHLYTSASVGSRLFVGSLAGLVELEALRVVRTYKTSNSRLSHDWVTALAEADGTLYVGTNGGGVDALLPTGEWLNFADELGKFEVNQNAMHFDGERLYVGTSDRGLLVYNTRDRRWNRISAGLASQNVTAITSDHQFVYVGTMNGLVRIEKRVI